MIHNINIIASRYDKLMFTQERPRALAVIRGERTFESGDWLQIHRWKSGQVDVSATAAIASVHEWNAGVGVCAVTVTLQEPMLEPQLEDPPRHPSDAGPLRRGDYVLATKYSDGDPQDHWAVGFYDGITAPHHMPPRYDVVDHRGTQMRGNGFRRVEKITLARGKWLLENRERIEQSGQELWTYFLTCPMTDQPQPTSPP